MSLHAIQPYVRYWRDQVAGQNLSFSAICISKTKRVLQNITSLPYFCMQPCGQRELEFQQNVDFSKSVRISCLKIWLRNNLLLGQPLTSRDLDILIKLHHLKFPVIGEAYIIQVKLQTPEIHTWRSRYFEVTLWIKA